MAELVEKNEKAIAKERENRRNAVASLQEKIERQRKKYASVIQRIHLDASDAAAASQHKWAQAFEREKMAAKAMVKEAEKRRDDALDRMRSTIKNVYEFRDNKLKSVKSDAKEKRTC